jgi:hypothetical protein
VTSAKHASERPVSESEEGRYRTSLVFPALRGPGNPELLLETDILSIDESVAKILAYLNVRGIV